MNRPPRDARRPLPVRRKPCYGSSEAFGLPVAPVGLSRRSRLSSVSSCRREGTSRTASPAAQDSSLSEGSSLTWRTEMTWVEAERQMGLRPDCTMATCCPPWISSLRFSSSIALCTSHTAGERHCTGALDAVVATWRHTTSWSCQAQLDARRESAQEKRMEAGGAGKRVAVCVRL